MGQIIRFKDAHEKQSLSDLVKQSIPSDQNEGYPDRNYRIPPYPEEWLSLSRCSEMDKVEQIPLLQFFFQLHDTIRRIGLLGIFDEYEVDAIPEPFLKASLILVLDGYRAERLERILNFQIRKTKSSGKELLKMMIIRDGCLSLIKGNSPLEAWNHLQGLLI